jgi:hypothetical protein
LALAEGEKWRIRFCGKEARREVIVSLGELLFFAVSSDGLLQSFFKIVINWRALSELPIADWKRGDARTAW